MKKIYLLIIIIISFVGVTFAQTAHDKISYQSVVRTGDNHLVYDTWVTVAVSIANADAPSTVVYSEKHTVLSNANGLISFLIGGGVDQHGSWNSVNWNRAEIKLVTSVNGNVLSTHTYPLSAVPYALYAKDADAAAYADSVDLTVVQNFIESSGYLTDELQVLSISNDTIYLSQGGWVKLPDGFSGDYNDLTNKPDLKPVATSGDYNDLLNKPTKSDLCDSVRDCVTGWISDSTRMVFDTLHNHYATKNALRDTAEAIRGAISAEVTQLQNNIDTVSDNVRGALIDTAAAIRGDMGDAAHDAKITIQKNGENVGYFTLNQSEPDTINILVPTTVAELTDAGNYVTNANLNETLSAYTTTDQVDTLLGDYAKKEALKDYLTISGMCDSVMNCNGIKAMKTDIQTVQTDIQTVQGDIQTLNTRITNDSTDLADKMYSDSLALAEKINNDSLTLAQRMDTVYKHLCDSVMECSGIKTMKTDIQTVQTDIQTVQGDIQTLNTRITNDSTDLADKMYSDSLALAEKINSDSLTLAQRMDTVYKHLCDSVMVCSGIKAMKTDIQTVQGDIQTLNTRITNDSTDLADKMYSDSLALAEKINNDSLTLAQRMDTVYKHLCDSVMECSGIKAIKTDITNLQAADDNLSERITNDSTDLAEKMYSDSLALAEKINNDSLTLAQRMDTVYKHLCDSVMVCSGIKAMKTDIQTVQGDIQTLNTRITNDSTDLADKMQLDSLALAEKINSDSLTLAQRMDTVYKHLCDSVMECSGIKAIKTDITNLQAADDNLSERITNDSTDLAEKISSDSLALAEKINNDSLTLAQRMDTVYKHLCDSVMDCNGIKAIQTDITNLQAADDNLSERITNDSTDLAEKISSDSLALAEKINNDSLTLAQRMDTVYKHLCDSVMDCNGIKAIQTDITNLQAADNILSERITNDSTKLKNNYYTKTQVDSVGNTVRSEIGKGKLTIQYGSNPTTTVEFGANQDTLTTVSIPTSPAPTYGTLTIKRNNVSVGTFTANEPNKEININVPTCDSISECAFIRNILDRLEKLEQQKDSLARELDKLKPALTLTASQDTVTVCKGSTKPVTYTATFHNCSSSDYTILWKVNGTDSSNVKTPTFTFNAPSTVGNYEVVCVATRAGNPTVTDTVTTTVEVDNDIPTFDTTVRNLTVELSNITNTATIQWDTDSLPVTLTGSSATKTYTVADTVTITATSERGCTLSKQAILQPVKPAVTTVSIPTETIKATSAIANGTVSSDGGIPSTRRGMVYSTTVTKPRLGLNGVDSVMNDGTGKGDFSCNLKRLIPCTQYYVCAFAINEVETIYGDSVIVITTPTFTCGDSLIDIDDNKYATLLLGSQCWMKQNLRVTHFADGTEIPLNISVYPSPSPCRYEPGSVGNVNAYGYLYNWAAAIRGSESSADNPSGVQGVCPDGWHLPSDAEWTQLFDYVASNTANVCDGNPTYIAKALASQERWLSCSGSGACEVCDDLSTNNKTGFSAMPSGVMNAGGGIEAPLTYDPGYTIFISATEYYDAVNDNYNNVWTREIYDNYVSVDRTATEKMDGLSVRCVLTCSTGHTYKPTVSAVKITNTGGTISLAASVDSDGGATVTERGVCWSKTQQPTADSTHTSSGSGIGAFSVPSTLTPGVTYYVRAYAINSVDTAYGAEVQLVIPIAPTVTTAAVTDITTFTAISGGEVTVGGSATVTARGVCWSTSENPTISDSLTSDGGGTGSFTSHITGLKAATTYYLRAYATNGGGTSYGSQVSFTTPDTLPEVTTSAVSNITVTTGETPVITVVCGGEVTSIGVDAVTARGVCWSESPNPTIGINVWDTTLNGSGLGSFTSNIKGLSSGHTYYVRAYATNSEGTAYGNQVSFTIPTVDDKSCPEAPTVIDHEGNVYATVKIGTQCWMRENLHTTTSPKTGTYLVNTEGQTISNYSSSYMGSKVADWPNISSTTYAPKGYGLLYNWCAVMDTANPTNYVEVPTPSNKGNDVPFSFNSPAPHRGICPAGWHVPSSQDWEYLFSKVDKAGKLAGGNNWMSSQNAAAPGNSSYTARDSSKFTALPAGKIGRTTTPSIHGTYQKETTDAYFWSSTQMSAYSDRVNYLCLSYSSASLTISVNYNDGEVKSHGLSVRCVRNEGQAAEVFVTTDAASDIAQTSVTLNGSISGSSEYIDLIDQKGFEWKPTSGGSYTQVTLDGDVPLSYNLTTGLTPNTSYTFRAFVTTGDGTTLYGYEKSFITRADHFIVETEPVTNIAQTSATLHGSIANPDPATTPVLVRGFEWKETDSVSYYQAIVDDDTQDYNLTLSYDLTVLKPNRSYTVRAFATVDTGTVYGSNVSFTTPSLSLSASPSDDTLFICAGSQTSITYTAAFANVNSSDYTISWKVNGTDSSAATNHLQLTVNVGAKGAYKVVCFATREGYSTLTDTIITYLNTKSPTFTVTTDFLIVNLSNIENTATIKWDMDSDPVPVSGTSATHDYTSKGAGTYTITATGPDPDGCTTTQCVTVSGKRYCSNVTPRSNENAYSSNAIDSLYDAQGHSYAVVEIVSDDGSINQCWMAQNLRATIYYDSVTSSYKTIPDGLDNYPSTTAPYRYNPVNGDTSACGYLYNWAAATGKATITPEGAYETTRGVCPEGWHLPSYYDYYVMRYAIDEEGKPDAGELAGTTPKTWVASSNQGSPGDLCYEERNSSGFSALRAGYYNAYSGYYEWGAFYWTCYSASGDNSDYSASFYITNDSPYTYIGLLYKGTGMSVRCVRDPEE